jgi:tryptophanyl-tRNA synthetase
MRERYEALMAAPGKIEEVLQVGAAKARALARPLMEALREAVGLRSFTSTVATGLGGAASPAAPAAPSKPPTMRQYREADGSFHFKLVASGGALLLSGGPFGTGADAGQCIRALRASGGDLASLPQPIQINESLSSDEVAAGLRAWIDASE